MRKMMDRCALLRYDGIPSYLRRAHLFPECHEARHANTTDDPLSRFLSLAWRTSSTIRPPSTLTAAVTTRSTRMVRAPWFMATRTPSSAVMVTQASVLPSSTWWETCCRVSASWWRRPSSTSGSDKQIYYMI